MYLKELTLRGFKSFATATTLQFEPGITAVIGPNGSGKSNIVDALSWVMGEQGVKNLRGSSMEDVIFAGTSDRPPLGRAQVSLTIDNGDHTLDIDYSEVTISRTIFRNGGSQYAINGTQCRLLDIQELLSDTGLGQQMHVIVGQGRLDAILRADPNGHRAFIEEAAGILKHRRRKERALRKLANTETNLSRLDDLLREIHRQLGPLDRQARISRKAEGIQVAARDAQARLFAEDALLSRSRREQTRTQLAQVRQQLEHQQRLLADVNMHIEQLETLSSQSSPALAALNQTWHELSQIEERLRSVASLAQERSRSVEGQIVTNLGEDPSVLLQRASELHTQAERQQTVVGAARLAYDQSTETRAGDEQRLAAVRQTLGELRTSEHQRDERIARCRELIAREEAAIELADTRGRDFSAQRASLLSQREAAQHQYDGLDEDRRTSSDDDDNSLEQARSELQRIQDAWGDSSESLRAAQGTVIALQSKADAINDTLEGRNASGSLHGYDRVHVLGRIADFIHVQDDWQEAVAQALGEFANAVVVPQRDDMLEALAHVAEQRLGKVTLIHPDVVESPLDASNNSGQADSSAIISAAAAISCNVHAKNRDQADMVVRALRMLLNDTALVPDRASALQALNDPRWRQSVTLGGEVFNRAGASGGSAQSHSDLSLTARRDAALEQMEHIRTRVDTLRNETQQLEESRDRARQAVDAAVQARTERQLKARQLEASIRSASATLEHLSQQLSALDEKIGRMRDEGTTHHLKLDDLRHALEQMQQPDGDHADLDELEQRELAGEQRLTKAREQEISAKISWNEASKTLESLERQEGLLRDQAKEARDRRTRITALNERHRQRVSRLQRTGADAMRIVSFVQHSITRVAQRREELQRQSSSHDEELKSLRSQRGDLGRAVAELQDREHALDVERERQAAAAGQLQQKITDALGMQTDELIDAYGPSRPVPVLDDAGRAVPYRREEQTRRLEKARRDLKALGKVNPLATEEFDALQKRNQYLNEQRNDIASSRDDLMQLVKDLDTTMSQAFSSAFADTAEAFQHVFATLFPGGRGRLRLENPDDLLTTGVIVEASPAGKRVKQLSLLSGGERSLTALALLFAIFTARPSPFYVMDEVEAALDSVNLSRLLDALHDLRKHAQLIIVTHQQRTMAIADALYGITMRADGVTAVMSQKLDQHEG